LPRSRNTRLARDGIIVVTFYRKYSFSYFSTFALPCFLETIISDLTRSRKTFKHSITGPAVVFMCFSFGEIDIWSCANTRSELVVRLTRPGLKELVRQPPTNVSGTDKAHTNGGIRAGRAFRQFRQTRQDIRDDDGHKKIVYIVSGEKHKTNFGFFVVFDLTELRGVLHTRKHTRDPMIVVWFWTAAGWLQLWINYFIAILPRRYARAVSLRARFPRTVRVRRPLGSRGTRNIQNNGNKGSVR